jgi:3-oxoacyl-[acyl-carrier protein] reductase
MDLGLADKVALVTAASSGIGRATAIQLAKEGAKVVVVGRDADKLREVAAAAPNIHTVALDLTSPRLAQLVPDLVAQHGTIDIAILNTGGPTLQPFLNTTLEQWDAAFGLLVRPAVTIALGAATHMARQGAGAILFLTSTWTKQPLAGSSCLTTSMRAALSALSKQMSLELGPRGVRVNQLMPGATATARMEAVLANRAKKAGTTVAEESSKSHADIPFKRWARPEETADAITFLVSERATYISGQTLAVDGGSMKFVY